MADVARQGVLVIDLNSANPVLADRLGLSPDVGLGELLAKDATPAEATPAVSIPGGLTAAALMIGGIATLLLGVVPAPLLDVTNRAADFIR